MKSSLRRVKNGIQKTDGLWCRAVLWLEKRAVFTTAQFVAVVIAIVWVVIQVNDLKPREVRHSMAGGGLQSGG